MTRQEREAGRHLPKNKRDKDSQRRSEMFKGALNGGKEQQPKRRDGDEDPEASEGRATRGWSGRRRMKSSL